MQSAVLASHITAAGLLLVMMLSTLPIRVCMRIRLYTFASWLQTVVTVIPKHAVPRLNFVTKQCRLCCQSSTVPVLVLGFISIHV